MTASVEDVVAILDRLIGFPTISGQSNEDLIAWVEDYLRGFGVDATVLPGPDGDRANLVATIGPGERPGGVILSGHTDVVPVDDQAWDSDPFRLTRRDGLLVGRGVCDMKGFLASVLAMVPEFAARSLSRPIHLAFSYDEEIGCLGVPPLVRHLAARVPAPEIAIIGEPTGMRPTAANKGIVVHRTVVEGKDAHSSFPQGAASAIRYAAEIVSFLYRTADDLRAHAPPDSPFDPPQATVNVGTIAGGTALNIVPRRCELVWEMRPVTGEEPGIVRERMERFVDEQILPRLRAEYTDGSVSTEVLCAVAPLRPETDGAAEALVRRLTGANATGAMPFATEAGIFQEAGISTIVIGPGEIAAMHQPDEWVTADQLGQCLEFLRGVSDWAAA